MLDQNPRLAFSIALTLAAPCGLARAADDAPVAPAAPGYETVVTVTTPLHGSRLPRDRVPANVQTASGDDVVANRGPDLSDYMNTAMASVHINQVQNNPLQSDLAYRGFAASPVLGTPQGLSMYVDGVRFNEPFGDTVNWDFLPSGAINTVNLMPGSNPLFGLNTLGGALSIETKDGFSAPGAAAHLSGGSFGRRSAGFELGMSRGPFGYFVAGDVFQEDGWRQYSPSDAKHVFADATYNSEGTRLDLGLVAAQTSLDGNGPLPVELLAQDRRAVFTYPDRTQNTLLMPTLRGEWAFGRSLRLSGVGYYRHSRIRTVNGDQARWAACSDPASNSLLCSVGDDGHEVVIVDGQGRPVPVDTVHPYDAADNATDTRQRGYGASLQLAVEPGLAGRENHLFVGTTSDGSSVRFFAQSRLARLSSTRGTLPTDIVVPASIVGVDARAVNLGLFASDTLALRHDLFLSASGRYNLSRLTLEDQVGNDLSGDHSFARLNPAVGLSYQPRQVVGVFAGYGESARAPTALELTCASPAAPCRLPNSFVADPDLNIVVARTVEAGVRGRWRGPAGALDYDGALFATTNANDILFVSAGPLTNEGYFSNVGTTQRRGVESGVRGRLAVARTVSRLSWSLRYTYLEATFRNDFLAPSPNHPQADMGQIPVHSGDRLPGVPRHVVKATLGYAWADRFSIQADALGASGCFARGDEANLLAQVPGYVVANLAATVRLSEALSLFVKVANVLDGRYSTFGVLGSPSEVLGAAYQDPRFEGPGAPRGFWAGLDLHY